MNKKIIGILLIATLATVVPAVLGYYISVQSNQPSNIPSPTPTPSPESTPTPSPSEEPTEPASIPQPSVPEFTVEFVDYSYYVPPTYGIDPYKGQNVTTQAGYHVDNRTVVFTIKNQPFTPYNDSSGNYIGLYYNFRFKGHYGNQWIYYPFDGIKTTHSYGPYSGGSFHYYSASNSDYTVISINLNTLTSYPTGTQPIPNDSQVDFQVQAQIGLIDHIPSGLLAGDFYSFTGEASDWSNTQTITIP